MGLGDLKQFISHPKVQVVAICDVDAIRLGEASKLVPAARTYVDWRELLEKEADHIESVNVAIREPGALLEWDAKNMMFTNNANANQYLQRTYRKGWEMAGFDLLKV